MAYIIKFLDKSKLIIQVWFNILNYNTKKLINLQCLKKVTFIMYDIFINTVLF